MNSIKTHITPLEEKIIEKLIKRLESFNETVELILYGSRAKGISDEESDLDIALITNTPLTHNELNNMKEEIMEEMGIPGELRVEVFSFTENEMKNLPIGKEISEKGILLWKKEKNLQKAL